jgi:hypothetical protein
VPVKIPLNALTPAERQTLRALPPPRQNRREFLGGMTRMAISAALVSDGAASISNRLDALQQVDADTATPQQNEAARGSVVRTAVAGGEMLAGMRIAQVALRGSFQARLEHAANAAILLANALQERASGQMR